MLKVRLTSLLLIIATTAMAGGPHKKPNRHYLGFLNNQASIAYTKSDINYREFDTNNTVLDRVHGDYPGIELGLTKSYDSWLIGLSANFSKGNVNYTGGIIGGGSSSVFTIKSMNTFFESAFNLGYVFKLTHRTGLIPLAEIGYRNWLREVPAAAHFLGLDLNGYTEDYINWHYGFGLKLQQIIGQFGIEPYFLLGSTFSASMHANLPIEGVTVAFDKPLGHSFYYKLGLNLYAFLHKNVNLFLGLSYRHFRFGRSPKLAIPDNGFIFEPKSKTGTFKVMLGLSFRIAEDPIPKLKPLKKHSVKKSPHKRKA